jgi:hypothetical protein
MMGILEAAGKRGRTPLHQQRRKAWQAPDRLTTPPSMIAGPEPV